jgi:hypothetical protein
MSNDPSRSDYRPRARILSSIFNTHVRTCLVVAWKAAPANAKLEYCRSRLKPEICNVSGSDKPAPSRQGWMVPGSQAPGPETAYIQGLLVALVSRYGCGMGYGL